MATWSKTGMEHDSNPLTHTFGLLKKPTFV